jgi:hypothetical protein
MSQAKLPMKDVWRIQSWWSDCNACFPRLTAARTSFGSEKGLGCVYLGDAVVDGDLQVNDGSEDALPEATARELGYKKPSTALGHDAEVG